MKNCFKCDNTRFQHGYYVDYMKSKDVIWMTHEQFENGEHIGFITSVRKCHCDPEADARQRMLRAKIPEKFLSQKFERKKSPGQEHPIRALYDSIQSIVLNEKTLSFVKGICLYGPTGTGKTTLLCQTLGHVVKNTSLETLFIDFKEHMATVKKNIFSEEKDKYIDDFKDIPILFIDDLSAGRQSQFEIDYIETLISYRYNNALPIFCTTNLTHDEMMGKTPVLGHRTMSRLQELCTFIKVEGEDIRKSSKKIIPFKTKEISG